MHYKSDNQFRNLLVNVFAYPIIMAHNVRNTLFVTTIVMVMENALHQETAPVNPLLMVSLAQLVNQNIGVKLVIKYVLLAKTENAIEQLDTAIVMVPILVELYATTVHLALLDFLVS
jgi:hypothetical protein